MPEAGRSDSATASLPPRVLQCPPPLTDDSHLAASHSMPTHRGCGGAGHRRSISASSRAICCTAFVGCTSSHGPIAAIEDGGQRVVFLFSPEFNQQVLSDTERFTPGSLPCAARSIGAAALTCGLLAMNGEQHRRNRRVVKEPFGLRAIGTYGETIVRTDRRDAGRLAAGRRARHGRGNAAVHAARHQHGCCSGWTIRKLAYRLGDMIARWVR